ncbi:MAG: phenylalanine--tRNA ligase subunit beta [Candidatus Norongarragalinales archaeon]
MVSIRVSKKGLFKRIGAKVSEDKVYEALHQTKVVFEGEERGTVSLEITADRPDLLSLQGVARAVRGFLGIEKGMPKMLLQESPFVLHIDKSVAKVRPVIACALVEGVKLDGAGFEELIQTQEKLTLTHGRRRRKVAIGVHDASQIRFPLVYKAIPSSSPVQFVPLNETRKMTVAQVMREHEKGMEYGFTLAGQPFYPVIFDDYGDIISFPPIINSAKTTVSTRTTKLLLDVTGTDFEACNAALNILCQDFADDGARVYSVKTGSRWTPEIAPEKISLDAGKAGKLLGLQLSARQAADCLQKQRLGARVSGSKIEVSIPRYRTDFLHWIDLVEEIAIGYGYNEFEPKTPGVFTIGRLSQETLLEERLRDLMVGAGFVEQWTYILTSASKHPAGEIVRIKNPVSSDYNAIRSSLLPSLFDTLSKNTHEAYPQKVFEAGEVVVKDAKHPNRTVSQRRLGCVFAGAQANFSEIASLALKAARVRWNGVSFRKAEREGFIEGRCVSLWVAGKEIGFAGEAHPSALEKMQVEVPVVAFELVV